MRKLLLIAHAIYRDKTEYVAAQLYKYLKLNNILERVYWLTFNTVSTKNYFKNSNDKGLKIF